MTSRVDYCNAVLAGATKAITDKLQRVVNAAARLITGTRKFDRGLSQLLHSDLHWLDVPQRVQYKLGVTMHRCLQHKAPRYLVDCCTSVAEVPGRRHLRSANRQQLLVPRYRRSALGPRAFSVEGLECTSRRSPGSYAQQWQFPLDTQDIPIRWTLTAYSALEADAAMRYRNLRLTLTLAVAMIMVSAGTLLQTQNLELNTADSLHQMYQVLLILKQFWWNEARKTQGPGF